MYDRTEILNHIKPCLKEWGITAQDISFAHESVNFIYRVKADDGRKYAMRVLRPGYHDLAELNSEQVWTRALSDHGINVPKSYKTLNGDYLVQAKGDEFSAYVSLMAWVEGQQLSKALEANKKSDFHIEMLEAMGKLCACMHNQAADWKPPKQFKRYKMTAENLMGDRSYMEKLGKAIGMTSEQRNLIISSCARVIERLKAYGQNQRTYSVIHADLHDNNVIVSEGDLVVLDFDDTCFGWHQHDLVTTLIEYADRDNFDDYREAMIRGYRQQREISDEDLDLLPLFLYLRTLTTMDWINSRPDLYQGDYLDELIGHACQAAKLL